MIPALINVTCVKTYRFGCSWRRSTWGWNVLNFKLLLVALLCAYKCMYKLNINSSLHLPKFEAQSINKLLAIENHVHCVVSTSVWDASCSCIRWKCTRMLSLTSGVIIQLAINYTIAPLSSRSVSCEDHKGRCRYVVSFMILFFPGNCLLCEWLSSSRWHNCFSGEIITLG